MDYFQMTAPCGLDCFNCDFFLARDDRDAMRRVEDLSEKHGIPVATMLCDGCRNHAGRIPLQRHVFGESHRCAAYECSKEKGLGFWRVRTVPVRPPSPVCRHGGRTAPQYQGLQPVPDP